MTTRKYVEKKLSETLKRFTLINLELTESSDKVTQKILKEKQLTHRAKAVAYNNVLAFIDIQEGK